MFFNTVDSKSRTNTILGGTSSIDRISDHQEDARRRIQEQQAFDLVASEEERDTA